MKITPPLMDCVFASLDRFPPPNHSSLYTHSSAMHCSSRQTPRSYCADGSSSFQSRSSKSHTSPSGVVRMMFGMPSRGHRTPP